MSEEDKPDVPKMFVSFGGKINVGNYESRDLNWGLSGVPVDCSAEFLQSVIEAALSRQQIIMNAYAGELDRILRDDFGR